MENNYNIDGNVTMLLKPRRNAYKSERRDDCLEVLQQVNGNKKKACRIIHSTNGFEKICPKNLRNWLNEGGRQGMKAFDTFEFALKNLLVFNSTMNGAPEQIISICFDYNLIRTTAFELREVPPFNLDEKLGNLKFSNGWIQNFLRRQNLQRRSITSTLHAPKSINLAHIRESILRSQYSPVELWNADETAITLNISPSHVFINSDTRRAIGLDDDNKTRMTMMIATNSCGSFMPKFYIIKNSVFDVDQRSSRVLQNLKEKLLKPEEWTLRTWFREIDGIMHYRHILQNGAGDTIVANPRAWMDTPTALQWIDCIVTPYLNGMRGCLVWDNFAVHTTVAVKDALAKIKVESLMLPPNCTSLVQPLDLIVNGEIKKIIRGKRSKEIYDYVVQWRYRCTQAQQDALNKQQIAIKQQYDALKAQATILPPSPQIDPRSVLPDFHPPKTTLVRCIEILQDIFIGQFSTAEFKSSISKTFIQCGLKKDEEGKYVDLIEGMCDETPMLCDAFFDMELSSNE
jgi:hypothetical protein